MKPGWIFVALCAASGAYAAPQSEPPTALPIIEPAVARPEDAASGAMKSLPAGTLIELELVDPIGSSTHRRGDKFGLRVAEPVLLDGTLMIPAGTTGIGEVVHAAASGGGGKPGELVLAARSLDLQGRTVPLRGMKIGRSGKDTSQRALALSMAIGPFAMFVHGHEIEIPADTRAHAKLAASLELDPLHGPAPESAATQSAEETENRINQAPAPSPPNQE